MPTPNIFDNLVSKEERDAQKPPSSNEDNREIFNAFRNFFSRGDESSVPIDQGVIADLGKSIASGLGRGAVGALGTLGDIRDLSAAAGGLIGLRPPEKTFVSDLANSSDYIDAIGKYIPGLKYKPQTTPGKYLGTISEFIPTAVTGLQGAVRGSLPSIGRAAGRGAFNYAVLPGAASETVGGLVEGTGIEPVARGAAALAAGGIGAAYGPNARRLDSAALVSGDQVAGAARTGDQELALNILNRYSKGMTPEQLEKTTQLMQAAKQVGYPITVTEAAQFVTKGGTNLSNLLRVVEGKGGLREFFAERPENIRKAGASLIESVDAPPERPSLLGGEIKEASEEIIKDAQRNINAVTRPQYDEILKTRGGAPLANVLKAIPLYNATLQEVRNSQSLSGQKITGLTIANLDKDSPIVVKKIREALKTLGYKQNSEPSSKEYKEAYRFVRSNPDLNNADVPVAYMTDLPDDNSALVNLVIRRMNEKKSVAETPGTASTSNTEANNYRMAIEQASEVLNAQTGRRIDASGNIVERGKQEIVNAAQAALRKKYLEPLLAGPIGKLRDAPTINRAVQALFPANPYTYGANEVSEAVSKLNAKNPYAARQLVRAHVESVFGAATNELRTVDNQFGGAIFSAKLAGDAKQFENLKAALGALSGGENIIPGFEKLLDIMKSNRYRQYIGSQTEFNRQLSSDLADSNLLVQVAKSSKTGVAGIPAKLFAKIDDWEAGKNTNTLAQLLVDPRTPEAMLKLAQAKQGGKQELGALLRLLSITINPANKPQTNLNNDEDRAR